MYEVLWTRILGLSFGHTTYAVTTVLAVFMGGLALGSRYFGKIADRTADPVRLYAFLELGIGVYCLAAPTLLSNIGDFYHTLSTAFPGIVSVRTLVRFFLASLVLLIPTTLMGGTLPAAARALVLKPEEAGRKVGMAYGMNTIGASVGAFLAGYVLLPSIGVRMTNILGASLSLVAGAGVLLLLRGGKLPRNTTERDKSAPAQQDSPRRFLLWAFAATGAVGMSYQIVWIRSLVLVIGSSTYAISAILVTFLLGIALGSMVYVRLQVRNGLQFFAAIQFGIALSALLLVPAFNLLPCTLFALFSSLGGSFRQVQFLQFLIVVPIILIPTMMMGISFPCLVSLLTRRGETFGNDLGRFYAWNTFGSILGILGTGFLFLPTLGAQKTLVLGVTVNILLGITTLSFTPLPRRKVLASSLAVLLAVAATFPVWDKRIMAIGSFLWLQGKRYPGDLGDHYRSSLREREVLFFREGISSTIAVARYDDGHLGFIVNGKVDAGNGTDMETQVNLAAIPMLLHPNPKKVAILGLGSGITAGTAAMFPETESIDIMELEPAVRDAARYFDTENHRVLENRKTQLHFEDGRNFIQGKASAYDILISEPSNPWMAGMANLFTKEFFTAVHRSLAPGGIYCQWLQAYSLSRQELETVARTLLAVFPDASLWRAGRTDLILLGRKPGGPSIDIDSIRTRTRTSSRVAEATRFFGSDPIPGFLANFLLDSEDLRKFAGGGPQYTDDHPALEYSAPESFFFPSAASENFEHIFQSISSDGLPPFLAIPPQERTRLLRLTLLTLGEGPSTSGGRRIPSADAETGVREDFENVVGVLPMIPRLGIFRPGDREYDDQVVWRRSIRYFALVSGIRNGIGLWGGKALVVEGVGGVNSTGYFSPVRVTPSTIYDVEVSMRSDLSEDSEAGVGILEYDDLSLAAMEPSRAEYDRHLVGSRDLIRVRGSKDWEKYPIRHRTSPKTRMIHLVFYRDGPADGKNIVLDSISMRKYR